MENQDIRNDQLYNEILVLIKSCIDCLKDPEFKLTQFQNNQKQSLTNSDFFKEYAFTKKLVQYIMVDIEKKVKNEFDICISIMERDLKLSEKFPNSVVYINGAQYPVTNEIFLKRILELMILDYIVNGSLNEAKLRSLVDEIFGFLNDDELIFMTIVPLKGFSCDNLELIMLSDNLSIKKVDYEYKIGLINKNITEITFPYETNWIIEHKRKIKKDPLSQTILPLGYKDVENNFNALITILRLFQEGGFGSESIVKHFSSDFLIYSSGITGFELLGFATDKNSNYHFESENLDEFIKFFNNYIDILKTIFDSGFHTVDQFNNLKVAIRRFNYSYQRNNGDDTIIDYAISMEALMSKSDDPIDSLSHRLSLRMARLLEKGMTRRHDVYKKIRDFYDLRSSIVHGGNIYEDFNLVKNYKIISNSILNYIDILKTVDHSKDFHNSIINSIDYSHNEGAP